MAKKILIFTTEMLPGLGYPTAGGGIRAWQIGEGLKSKGHEVIYSIPKHLVEDKPDLPDIIKKNTHSFDDLTHTISLVNPEIIVCTQWHSANRLKSPISVPVVIDLFGLRILEDAYLNGFELEPFFAAKIEALSKADFYICATDAQKAYFMPWIIMAGVD